MCPCLWKRYLLLQAQSKTACKLVLMPRNKMSERFSLSFSHMLIEKTKPPKTPTNQNPKYPQKQTTKHSTKTWRIMSMHKVVVSNVATNSIHPQFVLDNVISKVVLGLHHLINNCLIKNIGKLFPNLDF